jgi:hypothetical protein
MVCIIVDNNYGSEQRNIDFLKLIEKYWRLYHYSIPDYSKRNSSEKHAVRVADFNY